MLRTRHTLLHAFPVLLALNGLATGSTDSGDSDDFEWPLWAEQEEALIDRARNVNEGELSFIAQRPLEPVHHHRISIEIRQSSLGDGWVVMEQCHTGLDRIAAAQIVFNPEKTRALEVTGFRNMQDAFVETATVQLRDIGENSQVCARTESQALHQLPDGHHELRNGPFMRRFLDGYYPLQLSMQIIYPDSIVLVDSAPEVQPGFSITHTPGQIEVEAFFEGQLRTRFRFRPANPASR